MIDPDDFPPARSRLPIYIAAGAALIVGLWTFTDLSEPWNSPQPGDTYSRLPTLYDLDGRAVDGSVYREHDGSYPSQLPLLVLRGNTTYERDAYRVACNAVAKHLYAPGSARFAPFESATAGASGDGTVKINSYVDAQTPRGAMPRADFQIVLDREPDSSWSISQLFLHPTAPDMVPTGDLLKQPAR